MRCSRRTRAPSAIRAALSASGWPRGTSRSCTSTTARSPASPSSGHELHETLESEREADRGHVLTEEAPDHAVVAAAAAERVVHAGVRELEDRAGVVAHAAHEERVEHERDAAEVSSAQGASRRPPRRSPTRCATISSGASPGSASRIWRSPYGWYSIVMRAAEERLERVDGRPAVAPRSRSSATTPAVPILSSLSIVISTPGRSSLAESEARQHPLQRHGGR